MYERFYSLRERPFALSPDPDYLFPSRVHQEALDYLRYALESHAGFVVITGEIGSGKTTLLQTMLRGLDGDTTVARIVNTLLEPRELLEAMMIEFGLERAGQSKPVLLHDLAAYLVDQRAAGRLVLLVIDEAQNLGLAALEEIRMLSNLETEKSKLLQIVLVGQPDLRDKLSSPVLEQLRQRVTVSYHLRPLDADDTEAYINHRLRLAALGEPLQFPREVTDAIFARSRGVPRIINVVCDAVLVFGYAEERKHIDAALLADAVAELELTRVLPGAAEPGTEPAGAAGPAQAPPQPPPSSTPHAVAAPHPPALQSPLMPSRSAADEERRREVAARERQLAQRERELEEQKRILAEEYRLLRARRAGQAAPAGRSAADRGGRDERASIGGRHPVRREPPTSRREPPAVGRDRAGAHRFTLEPPGRPREGFWAWLRRVFFGLPEPIATDRS